MPKMNDDNRDSNTENPHDRGMRGVLELHDTVPIAVSRSMAACGCYIKYVYVIGARRACETV